MTTELTPNDEELERIVRQEQLLENRLDFYHWDLMPSEWNLWKHEYESLNEALMRGSYLHEPYFPGEE